jgi:hypothetical protein
MARTPKPSGRKRLRDKGRPLGRRRTNFRPLRPTFLIVCEGSKTEPTYFKRFRVNKEVIALDVRGLGDNTLSLVQRTCELMQVEDYAQVWCVFDRNSFPVSYGTCCISTIMTQPHRANTTAKCSPSA